jgi:hypothetical protein
LVSCLEDLPVPARQVYTNPDTFLAAANNYSLLPTAIAPNSIRITRAIVAVTLLSISVWTAITMDLEKIVAQQQPFVDSGIIEWTSGSVPIIEHFFPIEIFNQIWRGTMATFSPSTLGYDEIASWQMFSFLTDLGPLYAIFLLESFRPANTRSPAYL